MAIVKEVSFKTNSRSYIGRCQISVMEVIGWLSIFAKKLRHRCFVGPQIHLSIECNFNVMETFRVKNIFSFLSTSRFIVGKYPANISLFKVNNRNTKTCRVNMFKVNNKTPERRHWRRSGVFIFNFEQVKFWSISNENTSFFHVTDFHLTTLKKWFC